eukprot:1360068-Amorphochlora_amoeboformis.AAC.1
MALEAIYADQFTTTSTNSEGKYFHIDLTPAVGLSILLRKDSKYPFEPPLFLLKVKSVEEKSEKSRAVGTLPSDRATRVRMQKAVCARAEELCSGAPIIHE